MKKKPISNKDFSLNDLPSSRKEQFKTIFKYRLNFVLKWGLLLFVFFLPLLVSFLYKDFTVLGINSSSISDEEKASAYFSITIFSSLFILLGSIILSIGLSGLMKILKELIYDEPIFFKDDFKAGIKENIKSFLSIAIVVGLVNLITNLVSSLFSNVAFIGYALVGINFAFIYPLCLVCLCLSSFYSNSFLATIKSSLLIYIKHFPSVFVSFILLYGISFIDYINIMIVKYVIYLVYLIFLLPIFIIGIYLNFIRIFDIDINKDQFPSYYRKGLKKE